MRVLSDPGFGHDVYGSLRSGTALTHFPDEFRPRLLVGVDAMRDDDLVAVLRKVKPDAVVNCVGAVKQLDSAKDPLVALPLNALLPHRLARLCALAGARLVHVSTDCVFSGDKGLYVEGDRPDAHDLYGLSKLLGEVGTDGAVTLRTSIIGHEVGNAHSLIDWFLGQTGQVDGYARAFFSGLPTVELARVVMEHVLPRPELEGLYHVSAERISKLDLLSLVAREYGRGPTIRASEDVVIDRSLDATRFHLATGYRAPSWEALIGTMQETSTWWRPR